MNKKGFVMAETLVVTIFVLIIFTLLYNSAVPLLGRYEVLSYYNDLDTTYDLYHLRKLVMNDSHYETIISNDYTTLECDEESGNLDFDKCDSLFGYLNIGGLDELIYIKASYKDFIELHDDVSQDVKDYLKNINVDGNILLLQNDGYISYIEFPKTFEEKVYGDQTVCGTYVADDDGVVYLAGTPECVDFNYVWYSGKMWRIVAIYPDGSKKLVTDNNITVIPFNNMTGGNNIFYNKTTGDKSVVFQWLNEDFLDTLVDYEEVLDLTKYWNEATITDLSIDFRSCSKPTEDEDTLIPTSISPVGMLNLYEVVRSFENTTGSINNNSSSYISKIFPFHTITPKNNKIYVFYGPESRFTAFTYSNAYGVRPAIYLKADVKLNKGNGTYNTPYIIETTHSQFGKTADLLNTRISGEYIKFSSSDTEMYRVIGMEDNTTKIISLDYAWYMDNDTKAYTKKFASTNSYAATGNTESDEYWDYYLNHTWYNNLTFKDKLVAGTYYNGMVSSAVSYKYSICKSFTDTETIKTCADKWPLIETAWNGGNIYVGMPRIGEMFAAQHTKYNSTIAFWLATRFNNGSPGDIEIIKKIDGWEGHNIENLNAAYPTYNLKSDVKILSGKGTPHNPYIVE